MLYNEWHKLKVGIRNAKSVNIFEKSIISEKRRTCYIVFMIHSVLNSLRLLDYDSAILMNKFRHGCSDRINPMRACKTEVETTKNFLLCCHFYRLKD